MKQLRKKRPNQPVTIIVGIIYEGGIVVASDSQSSYSPGSAKRCDTDKIVSVSFSDNAGVIIAQSGSAVLSERAIEILQVAIPQSPLDDYRKPADLAQQAVKQVKSEIALLNHWTPGDKASLDYFDDNVFSLMLAYHYKDTHYLFILDSSPGIATRQYKYSTLGCGGTVGEFVLSRIVSPKMSSGYATAAAIYAVEEVKKVDSFCGGPTKFGVVEKGKAKVFTADRQLYLTECVAEAMEEHEPELRKRWKEVMDSAATAAVAKCRKKYPKD